MAKSARYLYHARLSVCLFILPSLSSFLRTYQHGSQWRDFREIWYKELIKNLLGKSRFGYNRGEKLSVTLHEEISTFVFLTHCGRVTQICVFNTVNLSTSASSP